MTEIRVAVAEDDESLRAALQEILEDEGYTVRAAADGQDAFDFIDQFDPHLVLSDVKMERIGGIELLRLVKRHRPDIPVLLMTAFGEIPSAVQAIQAGACDYLVKPFDEQTLVDSVKKNVAVEVVPDGAVVEDPKTRRLYRLAQHLAVNDTTIMITGHSGTGKEVIARFIHEQSARRTKPFVAVNCAAIPETMLEATLFGHQKGAFTGALQASAGKFEQAQGGTLLLDEISEMDLGLQAKLLRVIQEREVERLGGGGLIRLDIRILSTSNRDMPALVAGQRFREDLYYRLNVFPLNMPALLERPADIMPLAHFFLKRYCARAGRSIPRLNPGAQAWLQSHTWPGNIRELENVMQRAAILADVEISIDDLHHDRMSPNVAADHIDGLANHLTPVVNEQTTLSDYVREHEDKFIQETLRSVDGCREQAARKLGISPRTLRYKLARIKGADAVTADQPA